MKTGLKMLIAGLLVVAAGFVSYSIFFRDSGSNMTLLLRCEDGVGGTLKLVNRMTSEARTADAGQACENGSMEIGNYRRGGEIEISYLPVGSGPETLILAPGTEIETSPDGFFAVMAIRKAAPHLVRDKI